MSIIYNGSLHHALPVLVVAGLPVLVVAGLPVLVVAGEAINNNRNWKGQDEHSRQCTETTCNIISNDCWNKNTMKKGYKRI